MISTITQRKRSSVSLYCKSHCYKTAKIKVLSADSTHRSYD